MADSASPTTPATIRLHGVTKAFGGRTVVDVPDLTLGSHPIEGLIGPNGAGKTTLMRLVMHSIPLDSGSIDVPLPRAGVGRRVDPAGHLTPSPAGLVKTNQIIQDFGQPDHLGLAPLGRRDGTDTSIRTGSSATTHS